MKLPDPRAGPRLYGDLVGLWPFVSPPEHYVEEVETFVRRFRRHAVPDGAHVLHLGSGGGSIDYHLGRIYRVTGVDRSTRMAEYAARLNPHVEYVVGDMRTVRLDRTFDAVLVHDAIAYMTTEAELEQAYRTAAAHLRAGGVMIALPEELRERLVNDRTEVETRVIGDRRVTIVEHDHDADPRDHEFETTFVFLIRDAGGLRVEVDRHIMGVFTLDEFLDAMRRAGFDPHAEAWELSDWEPGRELPIVTAIRSDT